MWGNGKNKLLIYFISLLAIVNLYLQAPTIFFNASMKKQHDWLLARRDNLQEEIRAVLRTVPGLDFVFDLSDLGLNLDFEPLKKNDRGKFAYVEPKWGSHYASGMTVPPKLCGRGLVVSGPRFAQHPAVGKTEDWVSRVYPSFVIISKIHDVQDFEIVLVKNDCSDGNETAAL